MNSGYMPGPPQRNLPQPTGFSKNSKWLVPLLVVGVLVVVAFVGSVVWFVFGLMKSSEPYKHAVDLVMHDPQAVSALGAPVQPEWLVTGSIRLSGASGFANLAILVRGQLQKGTVYVLARKFAGEWSYQRVILVLEDGRRIDLLQHSTVPAVKT
jgi:hypothetical protein